MADEAETLPLLDEERQEGRGLLAAGASDDEEIVGVVDGALHFCLERCDDDLARVEETLECLSYRLASRKPMDEEVNEAVSSTVE